MVKPVICIAMLAAAVYLSIQVLSALFAFVSAVLVPAAILAGVLIVGTQMVNPRRDIVLRNHDRRDVERNH